MNTITKYVVLLTLCLIGTNVNAQDNQIKDSIPSEHSHYKIEALKNLKQTIQDEEREFLKQEVEFINQRLDKGEITESEADKLKKEAAKKRALNIENRIAIIDNKIELLKRNEAEYNDGLEESVNFGISFGKFTGISISPRNKPKKYDKRTTSDLVFAIGFNNAIGDDQKIGDNYTFLTSGFVELGWAWKTRVFKESNTVRLKYGFSFQWNKLTPKNDKYFVQNGNTTTLEVFPSELKESEFRITNLVVPIHFEFGPSKKIERKDYFRYSTSDHFKVGIGGYAGFNIGTQQKLRFEEGGDRVKQKIRRNYNASPFVYGLSGYVGYGGLGLYVKYDLSPMFKDQSFDQHNLSMGFRFDLD
ncbi:hypothetical protein [Psychroserpens algicola]|uniref:Outer membrane protein beta-barrel domain-containing protein n=1 Tax=Psychroserpens algicola TaxID=1719034 RepID=A0ABT0HA04_9FLAO|nr:hypothetical protein [Psychroserpens algicola]MCK8480834.1 hypothetical protein [Psychroserpens algicola]